MSIKKLFKEVFFPILALPLIVAPHECPDFFSAKKKGKLSFFQSFKLKGDNAMPYSVDESRPFTCIQDRQKPAIIMAQISVQIHRQPWPSVLHKVHNYYHFGQPVL